MDACERGGDHEMDDDEGCCSGVRKDAEAEKGKSVLMWGYLPAVSPHRSPLLSPAEATMLESPAAGGASRWRDVCGGGCGFAMAISEAGKIHTWGSTDDMGHSHLASGKHEENPEPFLLPTKADIVRADAGWAHCVVATAVGEVYTWGWKECVPSGRVPSGRDANSKSHVPATCGTIPNNGSLGEESHKRRKITSEDVAENLESSSWSQGAEIATCKKISSSKSMKSCPFVDETLSVPPCLVSLNPNVKITAVAAGGRHTLALSDVGQVWGWGNGNEGQLGLSSRIRLVSSPHLIPCFGLNAYGKDKPSVVMENTSCSEEQDHKTTGSFVKAIACGGRHSVVITDTGALLTFGWGHYGQCGQGSTDDELIPTLVSSLLGVKMQGVAAGLWHTTCISDDGAVYAFGGNQFGQLGTGTDQAENLPKLLEAPCLEDQNAKTVSCGARHCSIITEEGKVFCWGWNKYGQLGLGDAIDRSTPAQVPLDHWQPLNVSCGWWHTLLLAESIC